MEKLLGYDDIIESLKGRVAVDIVGHGSRPVSERPRESPPASGSVVPERGRGGSSQLAVPRVGTELNGRPLAGLVDGVGR